jgi:hypothetical protein
MMRPIHVTRGGFLKACGLAVLAPIVHSDLVEAIGQVVAIPTASAASGAAFDVLAADAAGFRAVIDNDFLVSSDTGTRTMRLSEVADGPTDAEVVQFSLTFTAPAPALPEGIYTFEHDRLDPLDLFIVPALDRDSTTIRYHACLSRVRRAPRHGR